MTDIPTSSEAQPRGNSLLSQDARTRKRNATEKRFRMYGVIAIGIAMAALVILLTSIVSDGAGAFRQSYLSIPVALDAETLDPNGNRDPAEMSKVLTLSYGKVLDKAVETAVADSGIAIEGLTSTDTSNLISKEASAQLRNHVLADPEQVGQTVDF